MESPKILYHILIEAWKSMKNAKQNSETDDGFVYERSDGYIHYEFKEYPKAQVDTVLSYAVTNSLLHKKAHGTGIFGEEYGYILTEEGIRQIRILEKDISQPSTDNPRQE